MGDDIGHPQYRYESMWDVDDYPAWLTLTVLVITVIVVALLLYSPTKHPCDSYTGVERDQCNESYQTGPEPDTYNM